MKKPVLAVALLGTALGVPSCAGDAQRAGEAAPFAVERSRLDDRTTLVSNPVLGRWRGAAGELVEKASVGAEQGEAPYLLGAVAGIAASEDRIYVSDLQHVLVRVYDWSGRHLLDIGREGAGPGEFRRPRELGIVDGNLLVRDQVQSRIHVFSPQGDLLDDWPVDRARRAMIGDDGSVHLVRDIVRAEAGEAPATVASYGPDGILTGWTEFPPLEHPPALVSASGNYLEAMAVFLGIGADWWETRRVPFAAETISEVGPSGERITGFSGPREARGGDGVVYRFEVGGAEDSVTIVEKEFEPVPVAPGEADWHHARRTALWNAAIKNIWPDREFEWEGPDLPATKAAYRWLIPDRSGRVWVVREARGVELEACDPEPADYYGYVDAPCWRQPLVAEVFADGALLGSVPLPEGLRPDIRPHIRGDTFIALHEDEMGVQRIKRYRLVTPGLS